ncbi:MAG TPA: magnesium chelatase domain-containing protein, partial [Thermoanaerobaculia bacterium]|nr:magnesium chelatase domain-containing protein [Thermoanaerobaculia bacterium]
MLARINSAATLGLDARVLDVEVDASGGVPRFTIVGLPDTGVREARERVRSALKNCGFRLPGGAVTVNLAPADFRKSGAALDLPVA